MMANRLRDKEHVCDFFGIHITTTNPNIARILKTDVSELVHRDIRHLGEIAADSEITQRTGDKSRPELILVP